MLNYWLYITTLCMCMFKLQVAQHHLSGDLKLQWKDIGFPKRDSFTPLMKAGVLPVCRMNDIF